MKCELIPNIFLCQIFVYFVISPPFLYFRFPKIREILYANVFKCESIFSVSNFSVFFGDCTVTYCATY